MKAAPVTSLLSSAPFNIVSSFATIGSASVVTCHKQRREPPPVIHRPPVGALWPLPAGAVGGRGPASTADVVCLADVIFPGAVTCRDDVTHSSGMRGGGGRGGRGRPVTAHRHWSEPANEAPAYEDAAGAGGQLLLTRTVWRIQSLWCFNFLPSDHGNRSEGNNTGAGFTVSESPELFTSSPSRHKHRRVEGDGAAAASAANSDHQDGRRPAFIMLCR